MCMWMPMRSTVLWQRSWMLNRTWPLPPSWCRSSTKSSSPPLNSTAFDFSYSSLRHRWVGLCSSQCGGCGYVAPMWWVWLCSSQCGGCGYVQLPVWWVWLCSSQCGGCGYVAPMWWVWLCSSQCGGCGYVAV